MVPIIRACPFFYLPTQYQIRLWNMLNGDCLRVIRGNSKNDAITSIFASSERYVWLFVFKKKTL